MYFIFIFIFILFAHVIGYTKKKNGNKISTLGGKIFSALVDEKGSVDQCIAEIRMANYYQHMDTEDLMMTGSISDIENGYLLFADLALREILSLYCFEGKGFNFVKNEMKENGFNKFFVHKVFTQLEV